MGEPMRTFRILSKALSTLAIGSAPLAGFVIIFSATIVVTIWKGKSVHWGGFTALLLSYALVYFVGFAAAEANLMSPPHTMQFHRRKSPEGATRYI
jgi:hypothetical protein